MNENNKEIANRNSAVERIARRSEHPTMSGSQVIGYHFVCECGHSEPDYIADEHTYCPQCGGRYADTITQTNEQEGENMKEMKIQKYDGEKFAINPYTDTRLETCIEMLIKGYGWALNNYPVEITAIATSYPSDKTFTGRIWTGMHSLRMLDAILSQRVLDGKMEIEELENVRTHSISHAFEFFKYAVKDGDCEWEDFFLPVTMELEAAYAASNKIKETILELVQDGWECERGIMSFDTSDDMTIGEYKRKMNDARNKLEEIGFEVSKYSSSVFHIVLDLELDGKRVDYYVEDDIFFENLEEYEKFLHETDV